MNEDNPYAISGLQYKAAIEKPRVWIRSVVSLFFVAGAAALLVGMFLPARRGLPVATITRIKCENHMREIGFAISAYEQVHGRLPPAYTTDEAGRPLHSWRALIVPFLEGENALADQIDFGKPWNHPANAAARDNIPQVFQCPGNRLDGGLTTYVAIMSPESCWRPGEGVAINEITDGRSRTLMLAEVDRENAVHWMSPDDCEEAMLLSIISSTKVPHAAGFHLLNAEGDVLRCGQSEISNAVLHGAVTIAGGEADEFEFTFY